MALVLRNRRDISIHCLMFMPKLSSWMHMRSVRSLHQIHKLLLSIFTIYCCYFNLFLQLLLYFFLDAKDRTWVASPHSILCIRKDLVL